MRGQTSLPALGVALLLLVASATFAVAVADGHLRYSRTESLERQDAASTATALVSPASALTRRANVLSPAAVSGLDAADLVDRYGLDPSNGVRVTLDGDELVSRGTAEPGTTIRRIILLERRSQETIQPPFRTTRTVTLPRRSPNATVRLAPGGNATIDRVRVDGRVVLASPSGLNGTYTVETSRHRTATLRFEGDGSLDRGDVRIRYYPAKTHKATLAVTVERWGAPNG